MKPNKFTNDLNDATLHTNGFAEAAGGLFGATSNETFDQRKQLEQNRRLVRGYRDSLVGRGYGGERPAARIPTRPSSPIARPSRQAQNATPTFREPPARGYNPYA